MVTGTSFNIPILGYPILHICENDINESSPSLCDTCRFGYDLFQAIIETKTLVFLTIAKWLYMERKETNTILSRQ